MKDLINAAKQALEALKKAKPSSEHFHDHEDAITALSDALEQQERVEPMTAAYVQKVPDKCDRIVWRNAYYHLPLAHPAPAAPEDWNQRFDEWWEQNGQYCRSGGGDYERTFAYRAFEAALELLSPAVPEDVSIDSRRLNAIAEEYFTLESFAMPTGGGDADVGWRVLQHYCGEKNPRVIAEIFDDDPRSAIDHAMLAVAPTNPEQSAG